MVKRYFVTEKLYRPEMAESPIGAYVEYTDYAALEQRVKDLEAELEFSRKERRTDQGVIIKLNNRNNELRAENERLVEAAEAVIRISDRKHDAWDELKAALKPFEEGI